MHATHMLKSWPDYFAPVANGEKNFELRKGDRDFKVGDTIVLQEYDDRNRQYTGRQVSKRVVYVMDGIGQGAIEPLLGLNRGYCILGLGEIDGAG